MLVLQGPMVLQRSRDTLKQGNDRVGNTIVHTLEDYTFFA